MHPTLRRTPSEESDHLMEIMRSLETEATLIGASAHMMAVAKKTA